MSRKLKNSIMIILIIILCGALYFTIQYSKNNNIMRKEIPQMPTNKGEQIGEPPEMPEGEMNQRQKDTNREKPENMPTGMRNPNNMNNMKKKMPIIYYVLIGIESFGIAIVFTYLLMSGFNKYGFKQTLNTGERTIILILASIIITAGILIPCSYFININNFLNEMFPQEETTEKETTAEDVSSGKDVNQKEINLSEHTSNITITEAGEYTLTGKFNYSVLVNATQDVTLNLDGVTIENQTTAAIANISQNALILNLVTSTTNTLADGGSSEYDGCIFSKGPLTIQGSGKLNIYGKQEEGEGIATETNNITINGGNINIECNDDGINAGGDGGTITINDGIIYIKASGDGIDSNKNIIINGGTVYSMGSALGGDAGIDADEGITINGGNVIALGSDMLEKPLSSSRQKSVCFNLENVVKTGTTVTLKNANNEIISTFEANEDFKTLIFSNNILDKGTYYLYKDGEKIGESEV